MGNIMVKYFSLDTGIAIIRINKEYYKEAWTSLFFLTTLRKQPCKVTILHTSGTIKLIQKQAILHDRMAIKALIANDSLSPKKAQELASKSQKEIQKLDG